MVFGLGSSLCVLVAVVNCCKEGKFIKSGDTDMFPARDLWVFTHESYYSFGNSVKGRHAQRQSCTASCHFVKVANIHSGVRAKAKTRTYLPGVCITGTKNETIPCERAAHL